MKMIFACANCRRNVRYYYNTKPYTETVKYDNARYYVFDIESIKGMIEDMSKHSDLQTSHYIPCPHCDYYNLLAFEMIKV